MRPQLRATLAHVVFHKVVLLRLILASSSPIRRSMLDAAGVAHEAMSPAVDEASLKQGQSDPAQGARVLAEAKALSIGGDDWTIGSDSVVSVDG